MKKQVKNAPEAQGVGSERIYAKKSAKALTLITCIVVAAVILFNIFFSIIGDMAMLYIDISRIQYNTGTTNLYTLSDYCKDVIENRAVSKIYGFNEQSGEDQKVKIIFCFSKYKNSVIVPLGFTDFCFRVEAFFGECCFRFFCSGEHTLLCNIAVYLILKYKHDKNNESCK